MSEEAPAPEGGAPSEPRAPKGPFIITLVNTIAVVATLGTLVYTRLLHKRPPITETTERERIAKAVSKHKKAEEAAYIIFEPMMLNIASATPTKQTDVAPTPQAGKLRYLSIGFTLELRNAVLKDKFEIKKSIFIDKFLTLVGKKTYQDLITVQGRYILKIQILNIVNQMNMGESASDEVTGTNIFFSQFMVQ